MGETIAFHSLPILHKLMAHIIPGGSEQSQHHAGGGWGGVGVQNADVPKGEGGGKWQRNRKDCPIGWFSGVLGLALPDHLEQG